MGSISTISRTLVNGIRRAACQPNVLRIPFGSFNKAPFAKQKRTEFFKSLYYNYVTFLKRVTRSEEHTSELQSRRDLVCRLLLEKKKKPSFRFRLIKKKTTNLP